MIVEFIDKLIIVISMIISFMIGVIWWDLMMGVNK